MNRKDWTGKKNKSSATDLRKKEKECRKIQQELVLVSIQFLLCMYVFFFFNF